MCSSDLADCGVWRGRVLEQLAALKPDLIIMSAYRYKMSGADAGRDPDQAWSDGLDSMMTKIRPLARQVLLLGDSATPVNDTPSCVAGHVSNVGGCMNSRATAVKQGRLAVERSMATKYNALFVPTSDWMCTDSQCPVVVGNVLMYRDNSHLTATASAFLAPYIEATLRYALG